jgi:hypothetical protein
LAISRAQLGGQRLRGSCCSPVCASGSPAWGEPHAGAVENDLPAVEIDELPEGEGVSDEVGGGVLDAELLLGSDGFPDVGGEARVGPGEKPPDELGRDGVGLDEPGQQPLPEEAHEQGALPLGEGLPRAVRCLPAVGREEVDVGMPLDEIAGGGDRDDDAGAGVVAEAPADELGHGLGGGAAEFGEQLPPPAQERTQQSGDGQDDVAVGDRGEHLLAQPLGPDELALLLARGAEGAAAAGEGDEHAAAALGAPQPGEAVLEQPAAEELPQHPLHDRPQRAVPAGEAGRPDSQQLLQVPLDQLEERRVTRPPRPVDPATDLHAPPPAGGRVAGTNGRRTARLSPWASFAEFTARPGPDARGRPVDKAMGLRLPR